MSTIGFFRESIKNIKTVGTVTRSSKFVCKAMIKHVDFSKADTIVELGAGDGVITKHILREMKPDSRLLSFEINELFCQKLNKIKDPKLIVAEDSAENLRQHLDQMKVKQADYIISALPFVSLPEDLSYRIVEEARKALKPGGLYIQLHYSLLTRKMYKKVFGNVDVNFEPLNIPPAFILVSKKK